MGIEAGDLSLTAMKALSIRHPWVDLILAGSKTIEIRTWSTRYRGPVLLHAGNRTLFDIDEEVLLAPAK